MRKFLPFVKREPEGFLVYCDERLITQTPLERDKAQAVFDEAVELYPKNRVTLVGVHMVATHQKSPHRRTTVNA